MCGIVGYISKNNNDVIKKIIASLLKLQHRGQDGAGICFFKDNELKVIKNKGYIKEAYFREILLKEGFSFEGNSDSEVVLKWLFYKLKKEPEFWQKEEINEILSTDFKDSAYCILILVKDRIFAFKDINS